MATYDLDEQDRLEQLKIWWKRWGALTMIVLAVLIAAAAGWRYWQNQQLTQSMEAAAAFDKLTQSLMADDIKGARTAGDLLVDQYAGTTFAPRAALVLARLSEGENDLKGAQARLEWVIANSKEPAVRDLAHLRLAGVLLDQKQHDAALKTLAASHSEAFAPRFADLRGDVLLAQGKKAEARSAYQSAFDKLAEDHPYRPIVELKLDTVGGGEAK